MSSRLGKSSFVSVTVTGKPCGDVKVTVSLDHEEWDAYGSTGAEPG